MAIPSAILAVAPPKPSSGTIAAVHDAQLLRVQEVRQQAQQVRLEVRQAVHAARRIRQETRRTRQETQRLLSSSRPS